MHALRLGGWWLTVLLLAPADLAAQEVFKNLSPARAEKLMSGMNIEFKKTEAKLPGIFFYDMRRQDTSVRLYLYNGKDIMLDAVFGGLPLEKVNEWNVRAKFSRLCLHKNMKGEFVTLESNLDITGGVTEETIQHFFRTFDEEIKAFKRVAGSGPPVPAVDEPIYTKVSDEKLEDILDKLGIKYKRIEGKGGITAYEYDLNGRRVQLTNFGGTDLMIHSHFDKLTLETVNDYNLKRKFIRTVAYDLMGRQFTSLETNLDCLGGISDSILRHFIRAFGEEVENFSKYLSDKGE